MASKFATVKLNNLFIDEARREAGLFHRSLAAQIEHWARLGRAIENAKGFSIDRVRAAMSGDLKIEDLSQGEQEAFFNALSNDYDAGAPALKAGYAKLGEERRAARTRRTHGQSGAPGSEPAA